MNPRVAFEIGQKNENWGEIVIELEPDKAPQTVENFLAYVDSGYYAGTIFHRVIPTFVAQGGGYLENASAKRQGLRAPVRNEAAQGIKNQRGTVAMARTGEPHSATSQFFINVADNDFLDHPGQDGWGYCAFGRVVEGMDVVERIRTTPTRDNPATGGDFPVQPPVIRSARRLDT